MRKKLKEDLINYRKMQESANLNEAYEEYCPTILTVTNPLKFDISESDLQSLSPLFKKLMDKCATYTFWGFTHDYDTENKTVSTRGNKIQKKYKLKFVGLKKSRLDLRLEFSVVSSLSYDYEGNKLGVDGKLSKSAPFTSKLLSVPLSTFLKSFSIGFDSNNVVVCKQAVYGTFSASSKFGDVKEGIEFSANNDPLSMFAYQYLKGAVTSVSEFEKGIKYVLMGKRELNKFNKTQNDVAAAKSFGQNLTDEDIDWLDENITGIHIEAPTEDVLYATADKYGFNLPENDSTYVKLRGEDSKWGCEIYADLPRGVKVPQSIVNIKCRPNTRASAPESIYKPSSNKLLGIDLFGFLLGDLSDRFTIGKHSSYVHASSAADRETEKEKELVY